jgi:hypothetical protein
VKGSNKQGAAQSAPPTDADPTPRAGLGVHDDHILGEISHEMGNYFHKLYYWSDYLKNAAHDTGELGAVEMLEGTVERLEHFMRMILEYFAPARLCFTKVTAAELIGSLESLLVGLRMRIEGDEVDQVGDTVVMVDASLIAHALRTTCERVASTLLDEPDLVVRVRLARRREYDGIEIEFVAGTASKDATKLMTGIEMAVAEKFFQMHGGELSEREGTDRALVVFLPLYT